MTTPKAPISTDPAIIEHIGPIADDGELAAAHAAFATAKKVCIDAASMTEAVMGDMTRTGHANSVRAREAAYELWKSAESQIGQATGKIDAALADIEAKTSQPPRPRDAMAAILHTEIRSGLARLSREARDKEINDAIENGDQEIVAAVLGAPPLLSGMTAIELRARKHQWRTKHFGSELARAERLGKARTALARAAHSGFGFCESLTDSKMVEAALTTSGAATAALKAATGK